MTEHQTAPSAVDGNFAHFAPGQNPIPHRVHSVVHVKRGGSGSLLPAEAARALKATIFQRSMPLQLPLVREPIEPWWPR